MNTRLKICTIIMMVLCTLPSFADSVENTTVASVDSSQGAQAGYASLPRIEKNEFSNLFELMTACVFLPTETAATAKTVRGASGLTEITYNPEGWYGEGILHQRGKTHTLSCVSIVDITGETFMAPDAMEIDSSPAYLLDGLTFVNLSPIYLGDGLTFIHKLMGDSDIRIWATSLPDSKKPNIRLHIMRITKNK